MAYAFSHHHPPDQPSPPPPEHATFAASPSASLRDRAVKLRCLFFRSAFVVSHKVSLGNIFRGQTGQVWAKSVALAVEVTNSARDEEGDPLPVVVSSLKSTTRR